MISNNLNVIIHIKIQVNTCDAINSDERELIYPLHISPYNPNGLKDRNGLLSDQISDRSVTVNSFDYYYVINLLLLNKVVDGIIINSHYVVIKRLNAFFNYYI